jgi:hypothetical protein
MVEMFRNKLKTFARMLKQSNNTLVNQSTSSNQIIFEQNELQISVDNNIVMKILIQKLFNLMLVKQNEENCVYGMQIFLCLTIYY